MTTTKLFCGNNVEVLRREVADNSVQLTVTSPPYDNLRAYNDFTWDFESVARELYRVTKPGGVVVWVVADATLNGSESGTSFRQALFFRDACGFNLHDTMLFTANRPPKNHNRYEQQFEYMFVFSKGKPSVFNPIREECKFAGRGKAGNFRRGGHGKEGDELVTAHAVHAIAETKIRGNIWAFAVGTQNNDDRIAHPAKFPEALARDHIFSWSNPGDTVLDPFLGSGTTGKVAAQLGRFFIGCDISAEYVELARKRISDADNGSTESN
jgi:DNA modification methylase